MNLAELKSGASAHAIAARTLYDEQLRKRQEEVAFAKSRLQGVIDSEGSVVALERYATDVQGFECDTEPAPEPDPEPTPDPDPIPDPTPQPDPTPTPQPVPGPLELGPPDNVFDRVSQNSQHIFPRAKITGGMIVMNSKAARYHGGKVTVPGTVKIAYTIGDEIVSPELTLGTEWQIPLSDHIIKGAILVGVVIIKTPRKYHPLSVGQTLDKNSNVVCATGYTTGQFTRIARGGAILPVTNGIHHRKPFPLVRKYDGTDIMVAPFTTAPTAYNADTPGVWMNSKGRPFAGQYRVSGGTQTVSAGKRTKKNPIFTGKRGDSLLSGYQTIIAKQDGTWIATHFNGFVYTIDTFGNTELIYGNEIDRSVLPSTTGVQALSRTGKLKLPTDIWLHEDDTMLMIADNEAGTCECLDLLTKELLEPAPLTGLVKPTSVCQTDGSWFLAQNKVGIYRIMEGDPELIYPKPGAFWVRPFRDGLVVASLGSNDIDYISLEGQLIKRFTMPKGAPTGWVSMDVDTNGTFYEKGTLGVIHDFAGGGRRGFYILKPDDSWEYVASGSQRRSYGPLSDVLEAGHYGWGIAFSLLFAEMLIQGSADTSPLVLWRGDAGGPSYSKKTAIMGSRMFGRGSNPTLPWGSRLPFEALWSRWGLTFHELKSFEEMGEMSNQELVDFIHAGMGTGIPRPEIRGEHLQALVYHIQNSSGVAARPKIAIPDPVDPVIGYLSFTPDGDHLLVHWKTDIPTVCQLQYGTGFIHEFRPLSDAMGREHSAIIPFGKADQIAIYAISETGGEVRTKLLPI